MMIVLIIVLLLVVGALVAVVAGRVGTDAMSDPGSTSSFELPPGRLGARDIDAVRFDQALRGYNMGQVDAVLDRLFDEIAQLESRLDTSTDGRADEGSHARGAHPQRGDGPHVADAEIVQFRRRERRSQHAEPPAQQIESTEPSESTPSGGGDAEAPPRPGTPEASTTLEGRGSHPSSGDRDA